MARNQPAPAKRPRKPPSTSLQMDTMTDTFAGKIKCTCANGRPGDGHGLVQCKRCEYWLHVNSMVGERPNYSRYEAETGYSCRPSCEDTLNAIAVANPKAKKRRVNQGTLHGRSEKQTPHGPLSQRKDPRSTLTALSEKASSQNLGPRSKPRMPARRILPIKPRTGLSGRSLGAISRHTKGEGANDAKRDTLTCPATFRKKRPKHSPKILYASSDDELPVSGNMTSESERQEPNSSLGRMEEASFYASMGQLDKPTPSDIRAASRRSGMLTSSATKFATKRTLSDVLHESATSSAEMPIKDARDGIQALRHGRKVTRAFTQLKPKSHARSIASPGSGAALGGGDFEDPVEQWMKAAETPRILCSCNASPAGNYRDYIICASDRCNNLQHSACIPPAETDTIAKGLLCEQCRDVRVEKMYRFHRDNVHKAKDSWQETQDRLADERKFRHAKLKVIVMERFWKNYCDLPDGKSTPAVLELTSTYFDDGKMVPIHPAPAAWVDDVLARIHMLVSPANKETVMAMVRKDEQLMSFDHPDRLRFGLGELAVHAIHHGLLKGKKEELGVLAEVLGLEEKGTYWQG